MSLLIFQLLVVVFSLFAIINVWSLKNKGSLGLKGASFWIFFWIGVSIFVMWPDGVQKAARAFGIGRGSDFILYISVVTLFYLVFKMHIKIEVINLDITKVVRMETIEKVKKL